MTLSVITFNDNNIMKKLLSFLTAILFSLHGVWGDEVTNFTFSKEQFSFTLDSLNRVHIVPVNDMMTFGSDTSKPGLPFLPVNIAIGGSSFSDVQFSFSKKLLMRNIVLSQNPQSFPTDEIKDIVDNPRIINYGNITFPDSNVKYVRTSDIAGINVVRLDVCPFVYDSERKELYLIESINLTISTTQTAKAQIKANPFDREMVRAFKDQIKNFEEYFESSNIHNNISQDGQVDYLIITSEGLKSFFTPLVQWKRQKGVRTKVATIEDIEKYSSGDTPQEKIKTYIYNAYKDKNVKFVMLGGDDTVVPVQYCYSDLGLEEKTLPTDLYYSCFGGDFGWNQNGNDKYGEPTDDIDLTPSVFLTRLPVRTGQDITSYTQKLLDYERNPIHGGWRKNILTEGWRINDIGPMTKPSDAEMKGDNMYENYIRKYWYGVRYKFYDSGNNLPEGENYEYNNEHIQDQLSNGYAFVDCISHGAQDGWGTSSYYLHPCYLYSCEDADNLENNGFTIITTNSCWTNAFDSPEPSSKDPCLSESFIRNPRSGVVAYMGCSRSGWSTSGKSLGVSDSYSAMFYKNLFSGTCPENNFGMLSAATKSYFINSCESNMHYRWIQFGLNPIGDPEMPIYTDFPKEFTNAKVEITGVNKIRVTTGGIDGVKMCVMSSEDTGRSYYSIANIVSDTTLTDIEPSVSICLTKANYIPRVFTVNSLHLQNTNVPSATNSKADAIYIGSSVSKSQPEGPVAFKSVDAKFTGKAIIFEPEITISNDCKIEFNNLK